MQKLSAWRKNVKGSYVRRHKLVDYLPLEVPFSIEIEPSSICQLKCIYCPQSLTNEVKKKINIGCNNVMTPETFERIAEQLKEFPLKVKNIRFTGHGEPLINKNISNMAHIVKTNQLAETVTIFTNGLLLTEELSESLVEAGVDMFLIDIQGINREDYKHWADTDIDFDKLYNNICYLHSLPNRGRIFIKTFKSIINGRENEFYEIFEKCSDEIMFDNIFEVCPEIDYTGIKFSEKGILEDNTYRIYQSNYCSAPWYQMSIDCKGRVAACCSTISKRSDFLELGNVNEEKLMDLWNGSRLNNIRYKLITDREGCIDCKDCRYLEMLPEEDIIDDIVSDLKEYALSHMNSEQNESKMP